MFNEFLTRLMPYCRQQMMNNIVREWVKNSNVLAPTRIFALTPSDENEKVIPANLLVQNDFEIAAKYYESGISRWLDRQSTFGIVHRCMVQPDEDDHDRPKWSFGSQEIDKSYYRSILLILFCPKEETYRVQQMLLRTRYHWYRKLSRSPLNSGFKSTDLNDESNSINIVYEPKNFDLSPKSEIRLDDIILNEDGSTKSDNCVQNFDTILCRTNLDNCMAAFLDDAFTLTEDKKIILKLNSSLVPFKLAITFDESTSEQCRSRLNEVADYMIANLIERSDISIYPFANRNVISIEDSDKLAIPYCAILKEDTLRTGVIWLRDRDTRITEMVHISHFLKTILFYQQREKLIRFDEQSTERGEEDANQDAR